MFYVVVFVYSVGRVTIYLYVVLKSAFALPIFINIGLLPLPTYLILNL